MPDVAVGLVTSPSSLAHDSGAGHPERPERIVAIGEHLASIGLDERVDVHEPQPAPLDVIELAHDPAVVQLLQQLDEAGGGRIDVDTVMGPGSLDATLRASQGTIDAAARVLDGIWSAGFVCTRPPGHHAMYRRAMGFCLTNHVAVAAKWAITTGRASRVLVVDWDAHHGNGTEDIFWSDPSVLYVSFHQYPWYPGTGDATDVGEGPGYGYTINIPLPAASAEDAYQRVFDELIEPRAAAFDPDLVFVSAGYDAHTDDPLCMMRLTAGAFFRFTGRVAALGPGPVCVLEGGYDQDALALSVGATLSALLGDAEPDGLPEPERGSLRGDPDAHRFIDRVLAMHSRGAGESV
jgi:acetoin utilization deacetylase AcuC-like enzyme